MGDLREHFVCDCVPGKLDARIDQPLPVIAAGPQNLMLGPFRRRHTVNGVLITDRRCVGLAMLCLRRRLEIGPEVVGPQPQLGIDRLVGISRRHIAVLKVLKASEAHKPRMPALLIQQPKRRLQGAALCPSLRRPDCRPPRRELQLQPKRLHIRQVWGRLRGPFIGREAEIRQAGGLRLLGIHHQGQRQDEGQQGAGVGEAAAYGILSGATEYFTERLFGGNPLVDTRPGLVNQVVKKLGGNQKLLSFLASQPVETLNEGLEEAISEILNPVWQRLTYDPNADFATLEQIMDSAIDGVLLAGFMQGGSAVMERALRGKSKNTKPAEAQNAYRSTTYVDANVNSRETASSPARSADARAYLNGDGPVTNSQAERIMDDASVMQELGIDTNGKTRSQIRKEVKAKVSEMRTQNTQSLTEQVAQKETELRTNVLESAKRTMGERGYATFEQAMRDDIDPAVYYRELTRAYNEGLAGVEGGSEVLTKVQYEEMWKAGRDDARASIEAQAQKAAGRVSYKDAGIDYADLETRKYVAASVDKQTAKAVDNVAKALGLKVRWADSVAGGAANADIQNGVVTIEKGNSNPVRFLIGHEITHRMQELAPQEYARLRKAVAAEMPTRKGYTAHEGVEVEQLKYAGHDLSIGNEAALDEVVADYVGEMLQNEGKLEDFISKHSDDRTLLERLRDFVRDLINKLKGTEEVKHLTEVEKRLNETLGAAVKQAGENAKNTAQKSGGEVKYSTKHEILALDGVDWMDNFSSIKQQLQKHADEINAMEPVAVVEFTPKSAPKLASTIMDEVAKIGGKNIKRGSVTFEFDQKGVGSILAHAKTSELQAAALVSPYVAKYGKLIAGQKKP